MTLMTKAEYGRRRGVSRQAITRFVRDWGLATHGPRGLVDADQLDGLLALAAAGGVRARKRKRPRPRWATGGVLRRISGSGLRQAAPVPGPDHPARHRAAGQVVAPRTVEHGARRIVEEHRRRDRTALVAE